MKIKIIILTIIFSLTLNPVFAKGKHHSGKSGKSHSKQNHSHHGGKKKHPRHPKYSNNKTNYGTGYLTDFFLSDNQSRINTLRNDNNPYTNFVSDLYEYQLAKQRYEQCIQNGGKCGFEKFIKKADKIFLFIDGFVFLVNPTAGR